MTYQLAPTENHRHNISKKDIQFWKYHFIHVLSGATATLLIHLWCQVTPQAEKQLLLLWQSNVNNKILLYAHLHDNHDYSALPFVPIEMEANIHENPIQRETWDEHAVKGCVLGTSDRHYCCWRLWVQKTRATRISGMVFFKHKYISNPTVTAADAVIAASQNMADSLKKIKKSVNPLLLSFAPTSASNNTARRRCQAPNLWWRARPRFSFGWASCEYVHPFK